MKKINENAFEVAILSMDKRQRTINIEYFKPYYERDERYPKQVPRAPVEANYRINDINSIVGYDNERRIFAVTWLDCDPLHTTEVTYEQFQRISNPKLKEQLISQANLLTLATETLVEDPSRPRHQQARRV